jgi:hypothetical protein
MGTPYLALFFLDPLCLICTSLFRLQRTRLLLLSAFMAPFWESFPDLFLDFWNTLRSCRGDHHAFVSPGLSTPWADAQPVAGCSLHDLTLLCTLTYPHPVFAVLSLPLHSFNGKYPTASSISLFWSLSFLVLTCS